MDRYGDIRNKLGRLVTNERRLDQFNQIFHRVLMENAKNTDYEVISGDGVVHVENLKRITDRIGTGSIDFYRKERNARTKEIAGRCVSIPSKDMLLLISVCLELDMDTVGALLVSAGYNNYVKNLKEFIIFCGLNNIRSIEDVSAKLFQHGYREQDALMSVTYKDETSAMVSFSAYFDRLCDEKGLDKKDVLERAGLISPTQDSEINRYYNSAFYGQKTVKIVLSPTQVLALFGALRLDYEEQTAYMDFLLGLGIIGEDDVELLLEGFKADIGRAEVIEAAPYPGIGDNSVFTQFLTTQLNYLKWEQLDEFILENFGTIRSFAVFYGQLVRYEGYKNISQFCGAFSLSAKSHYNYIAGVSLPALSTLTATAFLFRKMTVQIYNTMLKKAGKYIFEFDDDSAVYLLAKELLLRKEREKTSFGALFDCVEEVVSDERLASLDDDLRLLYLELVKILSRFLTAWLRQNGLDADDTTIKALRTASEQPGLGAGHFSTFVGRIAESCRQAGSIDGFLALLKEKFGFSDDSSLLRNCRMS
ncbi:hypothetical protein SAMN02745823_03567 [Sporobacter termitidis DSM 10068]|uniref:Uncharacterized protein n=1 Tax=Sporobacter termitidis DSM 10068 TaxID=1123282 RepID=A0A1M5ZDG7_9FIRM|nr:hypothetical protein [Sporobacter termitidis]SHI22209.1 hypothetical protein SAMN02745823_03567 [Sporobacter termitidis DSM 10068]